MQYKSYILSFLVFICLASCAQQLHLGIYKRAGANEIIEIKEDSTFDYFMKTGSDKLYSNGKWAIRKNNVLLLKSIYHRDSFPLFVREAENKNIDYEEIRIEKFFQREKDTILWTTLIINDTLDIEVKNDLVIIPKGTVRKLQLIFYYNNFLKPDLTPVTEYTRSIKTQVYEVKNNHANDFNLSFPDIDVNMFYYFAFNNDKVIIKGKKLHWLATNKIFVLKK